MSLRKHRGNKGQNVLLCPLEDRADKDRRELQLGFELHSLLPGKVTKPTES